MEKIHLHDKTFRKFITYETLDQCISAVAEKLDNDLKDENCPLFVSTLNGAFMFTAELLKKLHLNLEVAFVKVSSYQGTQSTGQVQQIVGLTAPVKDRTVVILEDIVDSGVTIEVLHNLISKDQPKQIKICSLLLKPQAYKKSIPIDYVAKEIPNDFIVGFGLDYDQLGRQYKDIYVLDE